MKTLLTLFVLLFSCSLFFIDNITNFLFEEEIKEIDLKELIYIKTIDGIAYDWRTDEILTAKLIEKNDSGKTKSITTYNNGKLDGLSEYYDDEGQVKIRIIFKEGKPISTDSFDKNGKLIEN